MNHILVVDDTEAIGDLFATILELHRYRASVASDPHAALEISQNDPIDGVITDFRMPGMNGSELIRRLRERQPDLPAIIVSGFANEAPSADSRTLVFSKPVNAMTLVQRMSDMLDDAETARRMK